MEFLRKFFTKNLEKNLFGDTSLCHNKDFGLLFWTRKVKKDEEVSIATFNKEDGVLLGLFDRIHTLEQRLDAQDEFNGLVYDELDKASQAAEKEKPAKTKSKKTSKKKK